MGDSSTQTVLLKVWLTCWVLLLASNLIRNEVWKTAQLYFSQDTVGCQNLPQKHYIADRQDWRFLRVSSVKNLFCHLKDSSTNFLLEVEVDQAFGSKTNRIRGKSSQKMAPILAHQVEIRETSVSCGPKSTKKNRYRHMTIHRKQNIYTSLCQIATSITLKNLNSWVKFAPDKNIKFGE